MAHRRCSYCIVVILAGVLYFIMHDKNTRLAPLQIGENDRDRLASNDFTTYEHPLFNMSADDRCHRSIPSSKRLAYSQPRSAASYDLMSTWN